MTRNGKAKRPLPLAASVAMYAIAIILAAATAIGNVYANCHLLRLMVPAAAMPFDKMCTLSAT